MKKAVVFLGLCFLLILSGCACKHEWKEATCTEPRICSKCGETEGEALGHDWTKATCTEAKVCERCGETEGEPLGHDWTDATCTEKKTCKRCGETEGEPLGHNAKWTEVEKDNISATRYLALKCSRCGEELETKLESIDTFIDNDRFTFTAEEFVERLQNTWDEEMKDAITLKFSYAVNSAGLINFDILNLNDSWLGWGVFYDKKGNAIEAAAADSTVYSIRIIVGPINELEISTVYYLFSKLVGPVSVAVDPTITEGSTYSDPILNNVYSMFDGKPLKGIYYSCGYREENGTFTLDIDIAPTDKAQHLSLED